MPAGLHRRQQGGIELVGAGGIEGGNLRQRRRIGIKGAAERAHLLCDLRRRERCRDESDRARRRHRPDEGLGAAHIEAKHRLVRAQHLADLLDGDGSGIDEVGVVGKALFDLLAERRAGGPELVDLRADAHHRRVVALPRRCRLDAGEQAEERVRLAAGVLLPAHEIGQRRVAHAAARRALRERALHRLSAHDIGDGESLGGRAGVAGIRQQGDVGLQGEAQPAVAQDRRRLAGVADAGGLDQLGRHGPESGQQFVAAAGDGERRCMQALGVERVRMIGAQGLLAPADDLLRPLQRLVDPPRPELNHDAVEVVVEERPRLIVRGADAAPDLVIGRQGIAPVVLRRVGAGDGDAGHHRRARAHGGADPAINVQRGLGEASRLLRPALVEDDDRKRTDGHGRCGRIAALLVQAVEKRGAGHGFRLDDPSLALDGIRQPKAALHREVLEDLPRRLDRRHPGVVVVHRLIGESHGLGELALRVGEAALNGMDGAEGVGGIALLVAERDRVHAPGRLHDGEGVADALDLHLRFLHVACDREAARQAAVGGDDATGAVADDCRALLGEVETGGVVADLEFRVDELDQRFLAGIAAVAGEFERLLRIRDPLLDTTDLARRRGAVEIEARQGRGRGARRWLGVDQRGIARELGGIGLVGVENRGDVGDAARRRHEAGTGRACRRRLCEGGAGDRAGDGERQCQTDRPLHDGRHASCDCAHRRPPRRASVAQLLVLIPEAGQPRKSWAPNGPP